MDSRNVLVDPPDAAVWFSALGHSDMRAYFVRMFRFTPAEAGLAELLISGKTVKECAEWLDISVHTARSHLKKLMIKTRTNRQGALIGLLLVSWQKRMMASRA